MSKRLRGAVAIGVLVAGLAGMQPLPSFAATTVPFDCSNPTESALSTDITNAGSGGTVAFNCTSATTIPFTSPLTLSQSVTLDASGATGTVTFDGGGTTQLLIVNPGVSVTVKGLTLAHGFAHGSGAGPWGGAIQNSGTLAITNSTFSGNSASFAGGAISNTGNGTLTISGSTLSGNSSTSYAGGIINAGTLSITTSSLSGNSACFGGALFNNPGGTVTITSSTLSGNATSCDGGAIQLTAGSVTITASTLANNSTSSYGGAIANFNAGSTVNVVDSTLSGNSAGSGGGITNGGGATVRIGGTIIANSPSGGNCANSGTLTDLGSNLIADGSCGFSSAKGDLTNTNPQLGPLQNNGGPTQTMALATTSPAIDKISTSAASLCATGGTDQRGVSRPDTGESTCDIGAYEYQDPAPLTITANNQTMPYGGPVPSFTASYSGFVNGDTSAVVHGLTCGASDTGGNPVSSTTPVGTYPITCSGATAFGYTISYVAGTLTISQATPQISWTAPADIPYGTALSATQLDATATLNGTSVAGTFVYTPAAGTVLSAGKGQTLSVSFTPTDITDYTAATASVPINVTQAALTITTLDQHSTYGTTTTDLTLNSTTIKYDGFVNGDTAASLTTPAQLHTTATKASPVGTYPITVDSAADHNYSITFVPGTLHVDPAPLTITPTNLTMTYKGTVPAYTWTATFVNGDTSASLTTQPICVATDGSGNPVSSSTPAGVYPITCTGAADPNYTISYQTGTLTVLYGTGGYLQPVDDTAHGETCGSPCPMSVFKAGQTIPFKFQIVDANGTVVGPDANPVTFTATYAGTTAQPVDESTLTDTATTGTTFTWTGTMYQYNWKSPSQSGSLYLITATFANGQTIQVTIGLR